MKKIIILSVLLIGWNCNTSNTPVPHPVEPSDTNYCEAGCKHLMDLPGQDGQKGCLEARPLQLPDGKFQSCKDFCTETQKNGRALSPKCWLEVKECSAIETQCRQY